MLELTRICSKDTRLERHQHQPHVPREFPSVTSWLLLDGQEAQPLRGSTISRLQMISLKLYSDLKVHVHALVMPSNDTLSYVQPCHDMELIISQGSERSVSEIGIPLVARQTYDNPTLNNFNSLGFFPPHDMSFLSFPVGCIFLWKGTCQVRCSGKDPLCVYIYYFLHFNYAICRLHLLPSFGLKLCLYDKQGT